MQQKRRSALARNGAGGQLFLDVVDAAKHLVVIGNHIVWPQESIELNRVEAVRAGVCRNAMDDEIKIVGKFFNFRVMPVFAAIFNGQRMKAKDIQQYLL